jgi:hypothetical protein
VKRKRTVTFHSSASLDRRGTGLPSTRSVPVSGIGACDLLSKTFSC